jgi:hypothetical protein
MYVHPDDSKIKQILEQGRTIAVVGLSDKVHRDSYRVARYMQEKGYRIIPVNPRAKTILNETAYTNILAVTEKIDIVNIFRRSDQVLPIVEDALKINPGAIWLQLGIVNYEAARLCGEAGVDFIMDKCIKVEHARLF